MLVTLLTGFFCLVYLILFSYLDLKGNTDIFSGWLYLFTGGALALSWVIGSPLMFLYGALALIMAFEFSEVIGWFGGADGWVLAGVCLLFGPVFTVEVFILAQALMVMYNNEDAERELIDSLAGFNRIPVIEFNGVGLSKPVPFLPFIALAFFIVFTVWQAWTILGVLAFILAIIDSYH